MVHGTGVYLVAAALGYLVLERADKHKGALRRIGQAVGVGIIAVSIVSALCGFVCGMKICPMGGKKMGGYCPLTSKAMPMMPGQ